MVNGHVNPSSSPSVFREVLEIFDEAAKNVLLSLFPHYERIASDIKATCC
jgi:hypothetical protein